MSSSQNNKKQSIEVPKYMEYFIAEMKTHVAETIEATVNGKVLAVHKELKDYIKEDVAWKVRAEPVVKAFENTNWLRNVAVSTVKFIGVLGGAVLAIAGIFKLIKNI